MKWNLTDLYQGLEDPQIQGDLEQLQTHIHTFQNHYPTFESVSQDPNHLKQALASLESIQTLAHNISLYATLNWSVATGEHEPTQLKESCDRLIREHMSKLEYFSLGLSHLTEEAIVTYLQDPEFKPFAHYLQKMRRFQPYTLSEKEEQILNLQQQFSRDRWRDFVTRTTSQWTFELPDSEGNTVTLTEDQAMDYLRKPDADMRKSGYLSVMDQYQQNVDFIGYIYNTLLQEYATEAKLRGFDSTLARQAFDQELQAHDVETLLNEVQEREDLYRRYYSKIKAVLKRDTLYSYDKSLPLSNNELPITYDQGQEIIINMLKKFEPDLAHKTAEFFDKQWIHAEIAQGKSGGAYCAPAIGQHPYILMNWNDNLYSLTTLAHELGHGLHFYETVNANSSPFSIMPPLYLAETASTFNEYLLAEHMMNETQDDAEKALYLNDLLQRFMNGVFRQSLITRFEHFAHSQGKERSLSASALCEHWLEISKDQAGDAIEVLDEEAAAWARIPHIFMYPFYCYNYTLSNLIVLNLIYQYQADSHEFLNRYRSFLKAGGSQSAPELMSLLGMDLQDPTFYQQAFSSFESLLEQFEKMSI